MRHTVHANPKPCLIYFIGKLGKLAHLDFTLAEQHPWFHASSHQCLTKHNVAINAKIALCILQFCGLRNNPHRCNYRMQDQIDVTVVHTEAIPSQFEITDGDNFSCNIVALMDTLKMLS